MLRRTGDRKPWQVRVLLYSSLMLLIALPVAAGLVVSVAVRLATGLEYSGIPFQIAAPVVGPTLMRILARVSLRRRFAAGRSLEIAKTLASQGRGFFSGRRYDVEFLTDLLRISPTHPAWSQVIDHLGLDDVSSLLVYLDHDSDLPTSLLAPVVSRINTGLVSGSDLHSTFAAGFSSALELRTRTDLDKDTAFGLLRLVPASATREVFTTPVRGGGIAPGEGARLAEALFSRPFLTPGSESFISAESAAQVVRQVLVVGHSLHLFPENPDALREGPLTAGVARGEFSAFVETTVSLAPVETWHTAAIFDPESPHTAALAQDRPFIASCRASVASELARPCDRCTATTQDLPALWNTVRAFAPEWDLSLAKLTRLAHRIVCDPASARAQG